MKYLNSHVNLKDWTSFKYIIFSGTAKVYYSIFHYGNRQDVKRMERTKTMQQEAGDRKGDGKHVTHILFLNYNLVCSAMFFPSLKQIQSIEITF